MKAKTAAAAATAAWMKVHGKEMGECADFGEETSFDGMTVFGDGEDGAIPWIDTVVDEDINHLAFWQNDEVEEVAVDPWDLL